MSSLGSDIRDLSAIVTTGTLLGVYPRPAAAHSCRPTELTELVGKTFHTGRILITARVFGGAVAFCGTVCSLSISSGEGEMPCTAVRDTNSTRIGTTGYISLPSQQNGESAVHGW